MSGILKRTIFYEKMKTGEVRFSDYAVVVTDIGTMVEPFEINNRLDFCDYADYDPTDMMVKVDEVQPCDILGSEFLSGGATTPLSGGNTLRIGK